MQRAPERDDSQAGVSSLWDLLKPDLQHSIIVSAHNLRKSEASEKYKTIRSMDFASRWEPGFKSGPRYYERINELQELLQEMQDAGHCLGGVGGRGK